MDAIRTWTGNVTSSTESAESLKNDIRDLEYHLNDLLHAIGGLDRAYFSDDTEDYEILNKAQGLWSLVSDGTRDIQRSIQRCADDIRDLRRAVEFYG